MSNQEAKRTVAQFINGVAVAVVTACVIGPITSGSTDARTVTLGLVFGMLLHGAALLVAG